MERLETVVQQACGMGKDVLVRAAQNPLGVGLLVLVGYKNAGGDDQAAALAAASSYMALSVAKDYWLEGRRFFTRDARKGLLRQTLDVLVENPVVSGLMAGTLYVTDAVVQAVAKHGGMGTWHAGAAHYFAAHLLASAVGVDLMVRGIRRLSRVQGADVKCRKKFVTDYLFEHPLLIGGAIGAAHLPDALNKAYQQFGHSVSAYLASATRTMLLESTLPAVIIGAAGMVLHSSSVAENTRKVVLYYYRAREAFARESNQKRFAGKMLEVQHARVDAAVSLEARVERLGELGRMCAQRGRAEESFEHYKKAMRLWGRQQKGVAPHEVFQDVMGLRSLLHGLQGSSLVNVRDAEGMVRAGFHALLAHEPDGIRYWQRLHDAFPRMQEYGLLYARGLEFVGRNEEACALKMRLVGEALHEKGVEFFARTSKNRVGLLSSSFLKTDFLVKLGDAERCRQEVAWLERAAEAFAPLLEEYVPRPVGIFAREQQQGLILELEEGQDMYDLFSAGTATRKDAVQVADAIAWYQARCDPSGLRCETRDDVRLLQERYRAFGYEQKFVDVLGASMRPLLAVADGLERELVKDAQLENFRKGDGLCVLDWEDVHRGVAGEEDARFLGYTRMRMDGSLVTPAEKEALVRYRLERLGHYQGKRVRNVQQHVYAFWNQMIVRAVGWCPPLHQRGRMDAVRGVVENALEAVEVVRHEMPFYYNRYHSEYVFIGDFLAQRVGGGVR